MSCVTRELLVRFYSRLSFSLRVMVHYRVVSTYGKPFNFFLMEEPWRVYEVLERALGRHNAELVLRILSEWLGRNGCSTSPEELKRILSDRGYWK